MPLNIIVAMTDDWVIGLNGELPWRIPADLKLFKRITGRKTVVMGRRTYESICKSNGGPLPNRRNIVVTRHPLELPKVEPPTEVEVCNSIYSAVERAQASGGEAFIIGGASIYEHTLPLVSAMHVSHIKIPLTGEPYPGDTYFPPVNLSHWEMEQEKDYGEFTYRVYRR